MTEADIAAASRPIPSPDARPSAADGPDLRLALLALVALILLGWALKGLSVVLLPLAAAVLIALAVMPVRDWVRARVPSWLGWLGPLAALALILVILAGFGGALTLAARQIVAEVPASPEELTQMLQGAPGGAAEGAGTGSEGTAAEDEGETGSGDDAAAGAGEGSEGESRPGAADGSGAEAQGSDDSGSGGGLLSGSGAEALRDLGDRALGAASGAAGAILNSALAVVGGLVLVSFLTLLILIESGDWRHKTGAIVGHSETWRFRESAEVIAGKVRAYLLIQTGLGFVSATLYVVWLSLWGIDLAFVWGLLVFVLNFIPNVGSLVGGSLPVAYALLTKDVGTAVAVGAGIVTIETLMGNVVAPRVQGQNVALSPLVILVALVFWGWAWGIAGALLAVPMTVALVVVGAHVPILRPWALLLSNKTGWAGLDETTTP